MSKNIPKRKKKEMETEENPSVYKKLRRSLTKCSFCPPHNNENKGRIARSDKHKRRKK